MGKALVIKGSDFSANRVTVVTFEGVHTESIAIAPTTIAASEIGATYQFVATLVPSDSADPIQWLSSDTSVATVADGLVTIVGCGTCSISAVSGGKTATCTVTVEVELSGYTLAVGVMAKPLNDMNDIPGWSVGVNPSTGSVASDYRSRAATVATDDTETKLSCDNELMTGTGSGGTLKPEGSRGWAYKDYGWTIPVRLPQNCTKLKVYALTSSYGSIPLFYKSNVQSQYYTGYICSRKVTGWSVTPSETDPSGCPWTYAEMTEYDVPTGYDSVNVSWFIPTGDVTVASPLFTDMSEAQLAAFKVICC